MTEETMRSRGVEHLLDVAAEGVSAVLDNKPREGLCCCVLMLAGLVGGTAYLTCSYLPAPQNSPIESVAPVESVDYDKPERE